jgi:predicted SAM-dependent methyltransferase
MTERGRGTLRDMRNLNIGSLAEIASGWENTDITPHIFLAKVPGGARLMRALNLMTAERFDEHRRGIYARLRYLDATKRFPYPSDTFDNIFSCHMLEHLYRDDAVSCVREVYRVLKRGGVFRLIVPDLDLLVRRYDDKHPELMLQKIYENTQKRDKNRHHWMYTAASLSRLLGSAGFSTVERCAYRQGRCPDLELLDSRPDESLFMEAVK